MGCKFCNTASMGFIRNLDTNEIVEQVTIVNDYLKAKLVTNIVYMGMGEPFDNLNNVIKSINIITNDNGLEIGKRKITVSTSGITSKLKDFHEKAGTRIAISLNASDNNFRQEIMPINQKYNIENIVKSILKLNLKKQEFITIEYVMFAGLNDSIKNAKELAKILSPLQIKVNLIPFNEHNNAQYKKPSEKTMFDFYDVLVSNNIVCNVRHSKGEDVNAACGQLATSKK